MPLHDQPRRRDLGQSVDHGEAVAIARRRLVRRQHVEAMLSQPGEILREDRIAMAQRQPAAPMLARLDAVDEHAPRVEAGRFGLPSGLVRIPARGLTRRPALVQRPGRGLRAVAEVSSVSHVAVGETMRRGLRGGAKEVGDLRVYPLAPDADAIGVPSSSLWCRPVGKTGKILAWRTAE